MRTGPGGSTSTSPNRGRKAREADSSFGHPLPLSPSRPGRAVRHGVRWRDVMRYRGRQGSATIPTAAGRAGGGYVLNRADAPCDPRDTDGQQGESFIPIHAAVEDEPCGRGDEHCSDLPRRAGNKRMRTWRAGNKQMKTRVAASRASARWPTHQRRPSALFVVPIHLFPPDP